MTSIGPTTPPVVRQPQEPRDEVAAPLPGDAKAAESESGRSPLVLAGSATLLVGGVAALARGNGVVKAAGAVAAAAGAISFLAGCQPADGAGKDQRTESEKFADDFIARFDHDKNGSIETKNRTGLSQANELVRTESKRASDLDFNTWSNNGGVPGGDFERTSWTEYREVSGFRAIEAADADADGTVTTNEMRALVAQYDEFGDGTFTRTDQTAFWDDHPEEHGAWRR